MLISGIQPFTLLDYPGKVSCIVFTPGCNFRCGFCHNPEFVLPDKIAELRESFIDEEAFFNFLNKRGKLLDGVVITGGEPTLMPDLESFIKKIKDRGLLVKLDTNGNRPEVLKKLVNAGLLDYVAMDVKTSLPEYKNVSGPWVVEKNIEESLNFLKEGKIDYEFRTTLVKELHTKEILDQMIKLIKGAKRFYLQNFRPGVTLLSSFQEYHAFSEEEMQDLEKFFNKEIPEVMIR